MRLSPVKRRLVGCALLTAGSPAARTRQEDLVLGGVEPVRVGASLGHVLLVRRP
ncbi:MULTISPECIES: hypothetical protein [unclassified Streptomyces]|uniref:hypothetical protein n=1 Tax=unclassified Streptomyces TaxID=2593676 RepID=UPI00131AED3D|nr:MULTISPECIES: hypothetical protein [unclassified Streptomyces]